MLEYEKILLIFPETVDYPTIKDYEGVWIQIENGKPVALITAEKLSETKLKSTILYYSPSSLGPAFQSFSYKNHYITLDRHSTIEHSGILKPDGTVSWKWNGGETGMGIKTWRRPDASDYIGNWIADKKGFVISILCEQSNVKQLLCYAGSSTQFFVKQLYDVDDGTLRLIHDASTEVIGKLQGNGNINWLSDDRYYLTWERKGKIFAFWNVNLACNHIDCKHHSMIDIEIHFLIMCSNAP